MFLDATTRKLQAVLAGAMVTADCPVAVDWVDFTATTTTPGLTPSTTNGVTAVDIVAAPAASTQRKINGITIFNADTANVTVTVRLNDNATLYPLVKVALVVGYTLGYTDVDGWYVTDTAGSRTTVGSQGPTGPQGIPGPQGPVAAAGGTVDAITADFTPDISLTDKTMCCVVSAGANTSTTPTFTPDGLTAHTITTRGGQPLAIGDIGPVGFVMILEYNSANTRWELLNPKSGIGGTIEGTVKKTTTYTAVTGDMLLCDTSAGAWSLTLPASPSAENFVDIIYDNGGTTNALTILANGNKIMSSTEDRTVNTPNMAFRLVYIDSTKGWCIK